MSDYQLGKKLNRSSRASVVSYNNIWPKINESVFLADGARIIGDVEIGEGSSIWFNTVVRGDVHSIKIGYDTNIQDLALIHCTYKKHATVIGNKVSIAHTAIIHGCTIEDSCLIGMGAVVMDGAIIGKNSLVGAHALVTQGTIIPENSLVLGSPAKVIRKINEAELKSFQETCERYKEYTKGYNFLLE